MATEIITIASPNGYTGATSTSGVSVTVQTFSGGAEYAKVTISGAEASVSGGWVYFTFDDSAVPGDAQIISVTCETVLHQANNLAHARARYCDEASVAANWFGTQVILDTVDTQTLSLSREELSNLMLAVNGYTTSSDVTGDVYLRHAILTVEYEAGGVAGSVTIGGVEKEISAAYVNIGGTWKEVAEAHANIGGTWKEMS